jgi:hypothetical protein
MLKTVPAAALVATRLSRLARTCSAFPSRFVALARLSLGGVALSMLPGCLIDDPPPYQEPGQTPPRINSRKVLPLLNELLIVQPDEALPFTIPFSSEDAGEGLNAVLVLDNQFAFGTNTLVPPSTLEDTARPPIQFTWPVRVATLGCHRLTFRLGHLSNLYNPVAQGPNPDDVAELYWTMNVYTDPALSKVLVDCPGASSGSAL